MVWETPPSQFFPQGAEPTLTPSFSLLKRQLRSSVRAQQLFFCKSFQLLMYFQYFCGER